MKPNLFSAETNKKVNMTKPLKKQSSVIISNTSQNNFMLHAICNGSRAAHSKLATHLAPVHVLVEVGLAEGKQHVVQVQSTKRSDSLNYYLNPFSELGVLTGP